MTPEAQRILGELACFEMKMIGKPYAGELTYLIKARGIKTDGRIHPADFGDAIIWEQVSFVMNQYDRLSWRYSARVNWLSFLRHSS